MTASDREYAPSGRAWAPPTHRIEDDPFAHVLIDEAQDLTPMQWRMVGRRGRTASWTIVGDPAQSSWPVPAESAAARAAALEGKAVHEFHLSTNYRNSSEIYEHAAAYAERVGLDADLPTAVRSTGVEPPRVVTGVDRPRGGDPRGRGRRSPARSPAPSASWSRSPGASEVNAWLASWPELADDAAGARAAVDSSVTPSGEDRVVVLTGLDTKGLEFDGIVVVAPAGDRGRVGHRPRHALRRPHPRHPAAHHRLLSKSPSRRRCAPNQRRVGADVRALGNRR